MFALDTNTLSYFFRGEGQVAENLAQVSPSDVAIPAIVLYEIEAGIERSQLRARLGRRLLQALDVIQVLPFDRQEARAAGRLRVELERAGTPIGPHDVLIAATALARGATLVTHNVSEFSRVPGLDVQDWY